MPVAYIPSPSASAAIAISTIPITPIQGGIIADSDIALGGFRQAFMRGTHQLIPRQIRICLVVIGVIIFGAILYALASGACRKRRCRTAAAARFSDGKRPAWVDEKGWLRIMEELRGLRGEEREREEREWQRGLEMQRQWEQQPQQYQQRRRWSDFTPRISPFSPYPTDTPLPAPHLLAAMLPQPTVQMYRPHLYPPHPTQIPPPQQGQRPAPQHQHQPPPPSHKHKLENASKLTKYWDENQEKVVGAVMVGKGSGVRRHVRVFGT
ncbi:MAG: hypothetical protein M1839_006956 [Geoglossum umbratile]|nr:MAG: hypothetical protein M1839_006956 [Geoglossum umbratile]